MSATAGQPPAGSASAKAPATNQPLGWRKALNGWWKGAAERAGKTVAQTLATSLIGTGLAMITFARFGDDLVVAIFAGLGAVVASPLTIALANGAVSAKVETFAVNAAIRCVFTFVETLAGLVVADKAIGLATFGWAAALSQALVAALLSILTSVASATPGQPGSPSLVKDVK